MSFFAFFFVYFPFLFFSSLLFVLRLEKVEENEECFQTTIGIAVYIYKCEVIGVGA